jgi:S1-C subfamily serine protease
MRDWFGFAGCMAVLIALWVILTLLTLGAGHLSAGPTAADRYALMLDQTVLVRTANSGHGSGVLIGPRTVLTAGHVVASGDALTVELKDGRQIAARVTARGGSGLDAAILTLAEPVDAQPARAACGALAFGDKIILIGNPLKLRWVGTFLRVSSAVLDKTDSTITVDGTIAPGMSGGPAFNTAGDIAGIGHGLLPMRLRSSVSVTGLVSITPASALCAAGLIQ